MAPNLGPRIGLAKAGPEVEDTDTQGVAMVTQGVVLLIAGLVAGMVGGALVYAIDKAFSRRQERYHGPA